MENNNPYDLYEELRKSLEKKFGYMEYFNHYPVLGTDPNTNKERVAYCQLCNHRSSYNAEDGSHVKLKPHIGFHLSQLEESMEEDRKNKKEADEVKEKEIKELRQDILKNAENNFSFFDYFDHNNLGNNNRVGFCKLCRIPVYYVLGESVSKLREHFDDHVKDHRFELSLEEEEKNKRCIAFKNKYGSSSNN